MNNGITKPTLFDSIRASPPQIRVPNPLSVNPTLDPKPIQQDVKRVDEPQINNMYYNWKLSCPSSGIRMNPPMRFPLKFKSYQPTPRLFSPKFQIVRPEKFQQLPRIPPLPRGRPPYSAQIPSTSQINYSPQSSLINVCCNYEQSRRLDIHNQQINKKPGVNHPFTLPAVPPLLYKPQPRMQTSSTIQNNAALNSLLNGSNFPRHAVSSWDRPIPYKPIVRLELTKEGILILKNKSSFMIMI